MESYFYSRFFKNNALLETLPSNFEQENRKQEDKFHIFQTNIANCSRPNYGWNSKDGDLIKKLLKK